MECLHTLLLGPCKYLLRSTILTLSTKQKEEVLARVRAFNYSCKLQGNAIRHHQSFVGRGYKHGPRWHCPSCGLTFRMETESVDCFVKGMLLYYNIVIQYCPFN